jgi:hypothetical protein
MFICVPIVLDFTMKMYSVGPSLSGADAPRMVDTMKMWHGHCLCWDPKHNFGKPVKVPYPVYFQCRADTVDGAHAVLHRVAAKRGFGLGGVQGIEEGPPPKKAANA